ncbi:putative nuclear transport factor 2 domain protein [Aspergillus campestris IBT 28561]|uniref:Nuclear transport factor 2 domain protein n=1 Tax=Aspergillus campestris (strain IBT 28561) TaxID=1392248 RepID=A0A2I1CWW5_ASPC2|nr:putative nuclear transport factor 2 domain protein [Aspergillus campestris IBT 28561]PKY02112.1 putative nuclear transport factor 2 domain protein [Aspergillus campestris IBT 28561]
MAGRSQDVLTKVSTEAATEFVHSFYPALQNNRAAIASFYSKPTATILFNGNPVADGAAVQEIFVNQMPPAHYEFQSFDCQILNPTYPTPTPTGVKLPNQLSVKDMSILVIVSGHVRYGESRDLPQRGFSETFILVPNPTSDAPKGRRKREWLIQTQNFRLVV